VTRFAPDCSRQCSTAGGCVRPASSSIISLRNSRDRVLP
jgi:hypothetical protein